MAGLIGMEECSKPMVTQISLSAICAKKPSIAEELNLTQLGRIGIYR